MQARYPGIGIEVSTAADGQRSCRLTGIWTLTHLGPVFAHLQQHLQTLAAEASLSWDAGNIEALDSVGATMLWRAWGRRLPSALQLQPQHLRVFQRIQALDAVPAAAPPPPEPLRWVRQLGSGAFRIGRHVRDFVLLLGQLALECVHLLRHVGDLPRREITANIYKAGIRAMPVTALVGGLIGVVLSYLSSLQLRQFGAEVFIIKILGLGCVREMGPVLAAVLVAGRSGSAMTAQLGVMRVTEEIDALATMGVSRSLRLVFPKVTALAIVMPFLVLWTAAAAILGGMVAAGIQLDISYGFFLETLPKSVPVANVWIALGKGCAFGVAIALVACHFGLRVKPNTESLSRNTTASVVVAITAVILIDAVFAIATRSIGI